MYKKFLISLVFISIILLTITHAQQRSIGKVEKAPEKADESVLDIPVKQWMGKRFIFLEKWRVLQEFGYNLSLSKNFYSRRGKPGEFEVETTYNLKYDKFVGKTIRVIDVEKKYSDDIVTFVEEESNMKVYAKPYKGYIDGIALLDDITKAKERWLGKTIYSKRRTITTYCEEMDKHGDVKVKFGEPLKVIDIWWGLHSIEPLWVIVETTSKEKGFVSTAFSWTNIYSDRWTEERPWENAFFEFNPKERYKWSDEIWELIDNRKVRIGMNKEQVKLSWGKPEKINKDIYQGLIREQWIYSSQYLYFDDDKLTAIQSR
ncbi:MAG: hypothetical protein DDT32_01938 [Syntrophomonadaceae bacterium]|nr:hypothetical protein [Candidatus Psychracetigena formicireducens]MBT9148168.1 hypothetical protein [Bacillota bacterium]